MLFPNWEPLNARICHAKLVLSSKMRPRSLYLNNPATSMPGRFTCISTNVIYCITSTPCEQLYIGNTGGKLADCFGEHLRHVEKNYKDVSKQVAHHYNLQKNDIFRPFLHRGNTEDHKKTSKKFLFQIVQLTLMESMNAPRSTNLFICSYDHLSTNGIAPPPLYKKAQVTILLFALTRS